MVETKPSSDNQTLDKDLDRLGFIESATQFVLQKAAAPGLGLIFLAGAAILASFFVEMQTELVVILTAAVLAAYMAMNIGANDVTNNVGAAVGARAITLRSALIMAAIFEIAGALIAGDNVVATIKSDIVSPVLLKSTDQTVAIMLAALLAAALWVNFATWVNAPVSTTHSIVGGIMGAGAMVAGTGAVRWSSMVEIAIGWVFSPILGALIATGFLWLILDKIVYRPDKIAAARFWVPLLLALMTGAFTIYMLVATTRGMTEFHIWHAAVIGLSIGAACYPPYRRIIARQSAGLDNRNASLKVLFRLPLVFAAALLSFAHGANDVANAIGPLAAIVEASGVQTITVNLDAPFWVVLIGALGISAGLLLFGPRLIRIVGSQITKLNPARAYCVAVSTAITVILASALGLPVSTTHVAVGAVFGVGLFREWHAAHSSRRRSYLTEKAERQEADAASDAGTETEPVIFPDALAPVRGSRTGEEPRYRYLVRRSYLMSILAAWVVTVPASGLLAAGLAWIVLRLPG